MSIKSCSKCNSSFECTNERMGCWCEDVFLSMHALTELKQNYSNCLCPKCLKEFGKVNYPDKK